MGAPFSEASNHHSDAETDDHDDMLSSKPPAKDDEQLSTYLSLISQYLSVFMTDNAIFIAERCLAQYPSSADARYLLALSYYRNSAPARTLAVLTQQSHPTPAMRFLAAQAALQLKDYARAEDILLKECRLTYQQLTRTADAPLSLATMDEWMVQTTVCDV